MVEKLGRVRWAVGIIMEINYHAFYKQQGIAFLLSSNSLF